MNNENSAGTPTPAAPVTAEPVAHLYEWIGDDESVRRKGDIIARSVEELNGNIDMHQHCWKRIGALSAAPVPPQPAAQVPSRDELHEKIADAVARTWRAALEEAADAIRTVLWQIENGDGLADEVYGAERCRDAISELIKGQPAAQVPSRDDVLEEAAEACMRATPDRAHVRRIGEAAHYTACRDAIRQLKGKPAAAHAANEGDAK